MPWQLTTPVTVGGLDAASYDQIRITRMVHDSVRAFIQFDIEYGRTVNDVWTPGYAPKDKLTTFFLQGQEYVDLVTDAEPEAEEKTYDAVKRGLYEWLNANNHIAAGTVV